ncbi:TonB-dependent receptor [Helicobacter cinaedi]|uniref:TonB-dependent receptor n=1 Tax=Helicobacter cinaedi TaxID=213 RepID=UPI0018A54E2A|nr:TonB-dependent receptor [Helicobacter cinaedi]QOQ95208.1 TonB-dependent receptor [Helicobacter cinaedi]
MKKYLLFFAALSSLAQYAFSDDFNSQNEAQKEAHKKVKLDTSIVKATMMNSKLDELNRNVYEIDKESITDKGYRSTEDIFRYTPFVGLSNVGLGSNLDLRGQGNRANTSVQVLINGIYSNMLDSSHGVTPLNTLSPSSIESIEILPGGGAVMYGNGTRGGVVNIITQRRYEEPFFTAGLSYGNTIASTGHSYNADAKFGTKLGDRTYISLGAAYINRGGPRSGDKTSGAQANMGLIYDITGGGGEHSVSFDVDYFNGIIRTSPNNSFMDIKNPSKDDRKSPGNGSLHNTQQRLDVSLGYKGELSENSKLDIKAFYHLNHINYVDSLTRLSSFSAMNKMSYNASADQSGSLFDDQKAGITAKYDLKHTNGLFILGVESIWNRGKRTMDQMIQATDYKHRILVPFVGTKWSNALYALEKYDFSKSFSLTGGARYEYAYYDIDVSYFSDMTSTGMTPYTNRGSLHNYALELTPSYRYSDSGNMYAKYERGYFSPSPNSMLRRNGSRASYTATNLKKETYDTFELGIKDFLGDSVMLSASAFYTLTHNEFYTQGNAHSVSGVTYGNYDKTQRAGLELFAEQYLFGGGLSLSESFTYIDARILQNNGASANLKIPYVSNYKGTIGANLALGRIFSLWSQNTFFGTSYDITQEKIKPYSLTDIGLNAKFGDLSLSAGVRNVFDTFYYSYYNHDSKDQIAGYAFLIGQGRSAFIEGRYTF